VTLWASVTPHAPLKALHKKVDQACLKAGVPPDHRSYLPHITIARLGRSSGPVAGLLESVGGVASAPFAVDGFCLFESALMPDGPVYSIVERYPLD
jgi:RNA 2',3'-cyclic 3'-phosphodiesterase